MKRSHFSKIVVLSTIFFVTNLVGCSTPSPVPTYTVTVISNPVVGDILADSRGMTLYVYENDVVNGSACYELCARTWPPLLVQEGMKPTGSAAVTAYLGTIQRTDGTIQVIANNRPLYHYSGDKKPGDIHGLDVQRIWFVLSCRGLIVGAEDHSKKGCT